MASWTRGRHHAPAPLHRTHAVRSLQMPQVLAPQEPSKRAEEESSSRQAESRVSLQHIKEGCLEEVEMLVMHGNFGPGNSALHLEAPHHLQGSRPHGARWRSMKHARHRNSLLNMEHQHQPVQQPMQQEVLAHGMLDTPSTAAVLMPPSTLQQEGHTQHAQPDELLPSCQHDQPMEVLGQLQPVLQPTMPADAPGYTTSSDHSTHQQPRRRHSRAQARQAPASSPQLSQPEQAQVPIQAIQLTQQIMAASHVSELHQLFKSHATHINHIHVCAALKRLQRLAIPPCHLPAAATPRSTQRPTPSSHHSSPPPSISNNTSKRKQRPKASRTQPAANEFQSLLMMLSHLALHHLPHMRVQEVASVMTSLARLKAPVTKSYHIAFMTHARHKFGDSDTNAWALAELLCAVAAVGMQGLRRDWSRAYFNSLSTHWQHVDVRGTVRILHALGTLQATLSPYWSQQLLDKLQQHMSEAHPQDVSNALWAITKLQLPASHEVLDALCTRAHQLIPLLDSRELAVILWSLAKAERQSSSVWQESSLQLAVKHLGTAQGHSLALMVYSLALLRWPVPSHVLRGVLERVAASGFAHLTPQGLGLLVYGVTLLGHVPSNDWLLSFHAHVSSLTCDVHPAVPELIRTSFTSLGFQPPRLVSTVVQSSQAYAATQSSSNGDRSNGAAGSGSSGSSTSRRSYTLLRPVRQHMYSPSLQVDSLSESLGHQVPSHVVQTDQQYQQHAGEGVGHSRQSKQQQRAAHQVRSTVESNHLLTADQLSAPVPCTHRM